MYTPMTKQELFKVQSFCDWINKNKYIVLDGVVTEYQGRIVYCFSAKDGKRYYINKETLEKPIVLEQMQAAM
jgi:hypothetical protein